MTDNHISEERLRLEHVLVEIAIREAHEDERTRTVNAKLTSILAVLPIVIALATSAFFEVLPIAGKLACTGKLFAAAFLVPIGIFCYAAVVAIGGLDPEKGTYSVVGMAVIRKYAGSGTYTEFLREMIKERGDAVKCDSTVNGLKLGIYKRAARAIVAGLIAIVAVAVLFLMAFFFKPTAFEKEPQDTSAWIRFQATIASEPWNDPRWSLKTEFRKSKLDASRNAEIAFQNWIYGTEQENGGAVGVLPPESRTPNRRVLQA